MRNAFFAVALSFVMFGASAHATDMSKGHVNVDEVWARASAGMAKAGAAYMTINNHGSHADRLMSVESDVAKRTEIHAHLMENGVMRMTKIEGISVEPGSPTVLKPGGLHVMFMGLKAPFIEGSTFPLTLVFEKAGRVDVTVAVQGVGSKSMDHSGHGQHDKKKHQMN